MSIERNIHNSLKVFPQKFILKKEAQLSALKCSINSDILVIYKSLNHFSLDAKGKSKVNKEKEDS